MIEYFQNMEDWSVVINIPEDVALRLEQIARQEGSSVGDLLKILLDRYAPETPPGSLAEMANNARQAGLSSAQPVDSARHSREILDGEYADILKRRTENDTNDNHH